MSCNSDLRAFDNKKVDDGICKFCEENFSCGVLKTSMEVLHGEAERSQYPGAGKLAEEFEHKILSYGFNYRKANKYCSLHGKRNLVQDLASEASDLIDLVRKR